MQVVVNVKDDPSIREKITLRINEKKETFRVIKQVRSDGTIIYPISMGFPKVLVPVIFGPRARVLGGMEEVEHSRQFYRDMMRRRKTVVGGRL